MRVDREGLIKRSCDVQQVFLDDDETFDAPWEYREVPITSQLLPQSVGPWTLPGDLSSCRTIRDWVWHHHDNDMLEALRQSPLLVSMHPETGLMDGWHRLFVAQERGLTVIPIILFDVKWRHGNGLGRLPQSYLDKIEEEEDLEAEKQRKAIYVDKNRCFCGRPEEDCATADDPEADCGDR